MFLGASTTQAAPLAFLFAGIIDDLRIYNRELNKCEIEEHYNGINTCTEFRKKHIKPNTVLIYVYDDGTTERVFKLEE